MSPRTWRLGRGEGSSGEAGAAILEYVLLVTLVALVAVGGLVYLGHTNVSPVRQAGSLVRDMALRGSARGGQGPKRWCSSGQSGCMVTVAVGGQEVIRFWVTGDGTGPYTYSLYAASRGGTETSPPAFLKLYSEAQQVSVEPTPRSCPPGAGTSYTYNGITLSVADHSTPPDTGQLTFSVRVLCS